MEMNNEEFPKIEGDAIRPGEMENDCDRETGFRDFLDGNQLISNKVGILGGGGISPARRKTHLSFGDLILLKIPSVE